MPKVIAAAVARWAQARPAPEPSPQQYAHDDTSLTIEEAAALLRRSTKWIYRHRATLPFIRKLGPRSYICSQDALNKWLARRPS
jgi:predicted DNA-binding transcriptional regulator AlpA